MDAAAPPLHRHVRGSASLAATLLALIWGLVAVGIAVERPGHLLEIGLIGCAGIVAWHVTVSARLSLPVVLVGVAAFTAVLQNTWPVQAAQAAVDHLGSIGQIVGNPPALFLLGIPFVAGSIRWRRPPLVLTAGASALVVAGAAAFLASDYRSASAISWLLTFVVPIAWAAVAFAAIRSVVEARAIVTVVLAASLVPLLMGIAAYVLEFGVPTRPHELLLNKVELYRPHLIQDVTFGNVAHLGDLALLVLPLSIMLAADVAAGPLARINAVVVAGASTLMLVLALERAQIVLALLAGVVVVGLSAFVRRPAGIAVGGVAVVVLLLIIAAPGTRAYVESLLPGRGSQVVNVPVTKPPRTAGQVVGSHGAPTSPGSAPATVNASTQVRVGAVRTGWRIFRSHAPLGVGPGEYQRYDPVHQAAHSLPVQILAEDGVLGLVGYLLLVGAVLGATLSAVRALLGGASSAALLCVGCLGGVALFLAEATVAGSLFAVGRLNVWGMLMWLELAIAMSIVVGRRDA